MGTVEKKTFLLLLVLTCVVITGLAVVLWLVPYLGLANIHKHLPLILAVFFGAIVLISLGGTLTLIFTVIRGRNLFFNRKIRGVVIRLLFPVLVFIGKCIGVGKEKIERSFIEINNQLVDVEAKKVNHDKLLILLPHCLQNSECAVRITGNVGHCKRCGKCKIKDLVELSERHGLQISVATGGTLARRIVIERKPNLIIGVACERDLTSGIQDSYPIPVYGVLNRRPFGPCFNTDVDLDMVEGAIKRFLKDEKTKA